MADLRIKLKFNYNPTAEDSLSKLIEKVVTVSGSEFIHGVQSIGTTEEVVQAIADIATEGFVIARNLDTTNYIELGYADVSATGDARAIKMKAGEPCMFRIGTDSALYALADTAACRLEYWIFED